MNGEACRVEAVAAPDSRVDVDVVDDGGDEGAAPSGVGLVPGGFEFGAGVGKVLQGAVRVPRVSGLLASPMRAVSASLAAKNSSRPIFSSTQWPWLACSRRPWSAAISRVSSGVAVFEVLGLGEQRLGERWAVEGWSLLREPRSDSPGVVHLLA